MVKTAVFVSGNGSNLEALVAAKARGEMEHVTLSLVVSSKANNYALQRAKNHSIDSVVVERKRYRDDIVGFETELRSHLKRYDIQLIVLAGFLTVFSPLFVKDYENRIINIHPALIPSFCGKHFYGLRVHQAALERGVKVSGATVHMVNDIVDGGQIILQKVVDVLEDDTPESLQLRIMEQAEWDILPKATEIIARQIIAGQIIAEQTRECFDE
ncbi:MAG: phosphoribosylglycinamide formyltransferase [Oscillospiraceae bacterium]|nr:phosphoribosylglycinamide formyltransferase [Oscillospiraceae bacterium]